MRKRKASMAPSPAGRGFLWTAVCGSKAGSAAWHQAGAPLPTLSLQGLTGLGLNQPQDQSCQKGESEGVWPESVHPGPPSFPSPAGLPEEEVACPGHRRAGCGRCHRKWGVGPPLPWVPGTLRRGPRSQASQHPVSLRPTLTPSLPIARAMGGEAQQRWEYIL